MAPDQIPPETPDGPDLTPGAFHRLTDWERAHTRPAACRPGVTGPPPGPATGTASAAVGPRWAMGRPGPQAAWRLADPSWMAPGPVARGLPRKTRAVMPSLRPGPQPDAPLPGPAGRLWAA
ncbi:hypothetical protein GCM10011428_35500 [Streptomyces violaceus]